jgi:hypothetical protein
MARILRTDFDSVTKYQALIDLSWWDSARISLPLGFYLNKLISLPNNLQDFDNALQMIKQYINLVVNQYNPLTRIEMQSIVDGIKKHWGDFTHLTIDSFGDIVIAVRLKDLQTIIESSKESSDEANAKKEKMLAIINAINNLYKLGV